MGQTIDPNELLGRLSEQQLRLLALVHDGTTASKALARETGLQPGSIDTYLHSAARILGTENRAAAARRWADLRAESSQSPSQLRRTRLVEWLKSAVSAVANGGQQFVTGLPLGGQRHAHSWVRVGLEIFRVGILGMVGVFTLVLFVLGFLKTFG